MGGALFMATMVIVIASCSKQQNAGFTPTPAETNVSVASKEPGSLSCGQPIPGVLEVSAKFSYAAYATGVQIYQVKQSATDPSSYSWVNIAPSATLYEDPAYTKEIGTHFGGPSWQFTKGRYKDEKVVAKKLKDVIVDATAVPWLLLQAVDSLSSAGNKIAYIQRVCTTGGLAPSMPANESNVGQVVNVPYTATYLFYE